MPSVIERDTKVGVPALLIMINNNCGNFRYTDHVMLKCVILMHDYEL